jgi:serine/threonine protein phosphatase PrpC
VGSGQAAAAVAPPTVFSGSYLTAGSRDKMEDFVTVLEDPFGTAGYHGCTALGVFDGHRWGRLRHGWWAAGRELSCNRGLNNNISLLRAWVECWKGWQKSWLAGVSAAAGLLAHVFFRVLCVSELCACMYSTGCYLLRRHLAVSHQLHALPPLCRGISAAEYLHRNLRQLLAAQLGGSPSSGGGDLLAAALAAADTTFRAQEDAAWAERLVRMGAAAAGPRPSPGSTATLLLTYLGWPGSQQRRQGGGEGQQAPPRQMLAVAHLGDSRVVLCRGGQVRLSARVLPAYCLCTACVLHVYCMCTACGLPVDCLPACLPACLRPCLT